VISSIRRFIASESAGGIVLALAAIVALIVSNSALAPHYRTFVEMRGEVRIANDALVLSKPLLLWVNDLWMAVFFFVVGLEIKRELVTGELRDRRVAALPLVAAVGGMVVPALIYLGFNRSGDAARGWGVPIATDIAFTLGVVAVLGRRVPPPLKLFLLTLAVVDDIGAIVVIAVVYARSIDGRWLAGAVAVGLAVVLLRSVRVERHAVFVVLGGLLWLCVLQSGIHATIAGVVMGLLTPARARGDGPSLAQRLEDLLHPWASFVIVPLFALANAGVELTGDQLTGASSITVGVTVGLVVGKTVGVTGAAWLAVRTGVARLPDGVRWIQLLGIGMLAGIGFTVALFVTGLAFVSASAQDEAKVGILAASIVAAALGALVLSVAGRDRAAVGARPPAVTEDPRP
jgi:NhaA family Na+:H+ antiporter